MGNNVILKFFRDKRNLNIHTSPIKPSAHYTDTITDQIFLSDSLEVVLIKKDGAKVPQEFIKPEIPYEEKTTIPKSDLVQEVKYVFQDWNGNEDVLSLSERYLQEIERLLNEGCEKGFI